MDEYEMPKYEVILAQALRARAQKRDPHGPLFKMTVSILRFFYSKTAGLVYPSWAIKFAVTSGKAGSPSRITILGTPLFLAERSL